MKKHIILVTYNWPPRNAIGTHRPLSWAKYWNQLGYQITVLTAKKYEFDSPLDLDSTALDDVVVHEVPYLPSSTLLFKILKFQRLKNWAKKIKNLYSRSSGERVDVRAKWFVRALPLAKRLAKTADIVVSTFGPDASHLIACEMKKENPALLWVADYRDLWSGNHLLNYTDKDLKSLKDIELATVGQYADIITTISEDLAYSLKTLLSKKVYVVANGFETDQSQLVERLKVGNEINAKPIKFVYTGMIYEGHRDPTPVFVAIKELIDEKLVSPGDVNIDFFGDKSGTVDNLVKKGGYGGFVKNHGHVKREVALQAQSDASFLLLLESPSEEAKGVLTGKIFEYLASGRPILSLGSRKASAIEQLLSATGTGICAEDNIELIKKIILDAIRSQQCSFYKPNFDEISKYSRQNQAFNLIKIIEEHFLA